MKLTSLCLNAIHIRADFLNGKNIMHTKKHTWQFFYKLCHVCFVMKNKFKSAKVILHRLFYKPVLSGIYHTSDYAPCILPCRDTPAGDKV